MGAFNERSRGSGADEAIYASREAPLVLKSASTAQSGGYLAVLLTVAVGNDSTYSDGTLTFTDVTIVMHSDSHPCGIVFGSMKDDVCLESS